MAFSRSQKYVLMERLIGGTEFTIDGIRTPSAHYTLAISEKKHFRHNPNIACELLFSHDSERFDYNRLREINDRFVCRSTLKWGFTHAEYKYENGEFYLIEAAARGGGNMISSVITQFMSGYDTYRYLVDCALGVVADADFSIMQRYRDRVAVLRFFDAPLKKGRIKDIRGLDVLKAEPEIVQYMLNFGVGDRIVDVTSDSERIGFYIACSENRNALETVMNKVEKSFEIVLEEEAHEG